MCVSCACLGTGSREQEKRVDLARIRTRSRRAQLPAARSGYHLPVEGFPPGLAVRDIPLAAIEAAARAIYNPVVRTPLVRLHLPQTAADAPRDAEIFLKL